MSRDPLLVVILGPTGSGKTSLSLSLATRFSGEIVNCDSVAMYREFVIGTAKPTPEEQCLVPHHLLDVIDPTGYTTAGEYARQARAVIRKISHRGAMPIVVGGTGLYLRALLEGLFPGPERSEELRERLRRASKNKGTQHLHRILRRLDSESAEKIHPNDTPKLIRAVEVCLAARQPMTSPIQRTPRWMGTPMSEQWQVGREPLLGFRILRIGLDPRREALYERINCRVEAMFAAGLIEETRRLLQRYGPAVRPLASIGYKQVAQLLTGKLDRDSALAAVQQAHRNYAKRQMTWFRREPDVQWISQFGDQTDAQHLAAKLLQEQLG